MVKCGTIMGLINKSRGGKMMKLGKNEILNAIAWQGLEREIFMHLFRYSERLHNQLSPDDCCEVFAEILQGQGDIDKELLRGLENDYDVYLVKILTEEENNRGNK